MFFLSILLLGVSALPAEKTSENLNGKTAVCPLNTDWLDVKNDSRIGFAVDARINGRPTQAIIDTGAPHTTISTKIADILMIPYTKGKPTNFLNKIESTFDTGSVNISLGESNIVRKSSIAVDFKYFDLLDIPVDLVVGRDILRFCELAFDRKTSKLNISENTKHGYSKYINLLEQNSDKFLYLYVALPSGEKIKSYLDTGSGSEYHITSDREGSKIIGDNAKITTVPINSLVAVSVEELAILPKVNIGRYAVKDLNIYFAQSKPENGVPNPTLGLIGRPTLERFDFVIDFKKNKLFIGDDVAPSPQIIKSTSGLIVIPVLNYLSVVHVMRNSPAERAGWKLGAEICTVDGQDIPKNYFESSLRSWTIDKPGRRVSLKLCSGEIRTLTLEEFY